MSVRDDNPRQVAGHVTPQAIRTYLDPRQVEGLREFFQAQADERLDRWRDPEQPERVVYRYGDDRLLILDETDGDHWMAHFIEGGLHTEVGDAESTVAAWLAAHPEPKPWQDAEPGELWSVTTANQEDVRCFVVHNEPISFVTTDDTHHFLDAIVSAHRIYPPADPS
ncbi:hypothetical protein [Pseudoclavibacter helvolus]|uniref:hypothetical protein n=1 Tax=Pseudoclavibacter helvolus TaxID=255205 RepID=UPI003C77F487